MSYLPESAGAVTSAGSEGVFLPKAVHQEQGDHNFFRGLQYYLRGFFYWHISLYMSLSDIRRRYKRTVLGPFWVTLSVAIFISSMGIIFPILWHIEAKTYIPFFSSGFIIWTFFSSIITDSCGAFLDAGTLIKQTSLPYSVYAHVVVIRNFFILLHHGLVFVAVMFVFHVPVNFNTLLLIPALIILCVTGSWFSLLFGLFSLRFRDVRQIVTSFLQVSMFITPVFWSADQLGSGFRAKLMVLLNPLYHFVEIAREPLLGRQPSITDWIATILFCIVGWLLTMRVFGKYYRHIVFWL